MLLHQETQDLIDVDQLAQRIGISAKTIYNRLSDPKTRELMPPRTYMPAAPSRVLFRAADVAIWLDNLARGYTTAKGQGTVEAPKRGRGRPRKSEAVARQLYSKSAN